MLILSRQLDERIHLDSPSGRVTITVTELGRGRVKLGIDAPGDVVIAREEIADGFRRAPPPSPFLPRVFPEK
jgi:carbon storage regulator CsrA